MIGHCVQGNREHALDKPLIIWALAMVLILTVLGSYFILGTGGDLRLHFPELVFFTAIVVCCLVTLCWLHPPCHENWLIAAILLPAIIMRLLFVTRIPELSDDLFRYVWDGLQLLQGHSPYAFAPEQLVPVGGRELAVHSLINHPHLVTIYPPLAQVLFAATGGTVLGMKVLCVVFDLGNCLLLAALLKHLKGNLWWLILYAWHPLVVLESAASAHIDIAALFFVLFSLWVIVKRWRFAAPIAGILLGGAVMIKLFPLLFAPFFMLALPPGERRNFLLALVLSCVMVTLPFLPQITNAVNTLQQYVQHWEFSSFSFRLLRTLFYSGEHARLLLLTLFGCIVGRQWWALGQGIVTLPRVVKTCRSVLLVFLLLTPTLHPWYAIYLVAFIPLSPSTSAIVLSWSVLLSYQVVAGYHLTGLWQESSLISFYVWLAPVSALLATAVLFLRGKRRSKRLSKE